ncbi:MAG: hypothetical protein IJ626_02750, partial [Muribaculaceae bacterium]|nr:hypothetical protein [Muribaculaceae bacterium]
DDNDYYMYPITLSNELKSIGAKLLGSGKFVNGYAGSGLTFYDGDYFTLDGDLYYNARYFRFRIEAPEGYSISNVKVNDTEARLETDTVNYPKGSYYLEFPSADNIGDAVITADINSIVIDANNDDNSSMLYYNHGKKLNVSLKNTTLYKDGRWNTLTLPFDVELSGSPLSGAEARTVTAASISGNKLDLTFGDAVTSLQAGVPYIIKWTAGDNIVNPVFNAVTINNAAHDADFGSADTRFRFMGTYDAVTFTEADSKSVLMMSASTKANGNRRLVNGTDNLLNYVSGDQQIGACQSYFKVGDDDATSPAHINSFNITFGDEPITGITSLEADTKTGDNAWYTIDGRRLNGKPTQCGIYINNGKKIVIK